MAADGRPAGHPPGKGPLQTQISDDRARLRPAVRPPRPRPELPRHQSRPRTAPTGHQPQPAQGNPRTAPQGRRRPRHPGPASLLNLASRPGKSSPQAAASPARQQPPSQPPRNPPPSNRAPKLSDILRGPPDPPRS